MRKLILFLVGMFLMMMLTTATAFAVGPLSPPDVSVGHGGCDPEWWHWGDDDDADDDADDDVDDDCDGCFVDGVCYADGTVNSANACLECNPGNSDTGWSAVQNDTPCDDGLFCNGADACDYGVCTAHAGTPCSESDACNEDIDQCEWCPKGGCVHFMNRLVTGGPDMDNVYLEMRVAFNANDEVQGFGNSVHVTRQDLIDGYAYLVAETVAGQAIEVQKNLVTGNSDADRYYTTIPLEVGNFRLKLQMADGQSFYAYPEEFAMEGELYPCVKMIFSRVPDGSFVRIFVDGSSPNGFITLGMQRPVVVLNFIVPVGLDGGMAVRSRFEINGEDEVLPENFSNPRLYSVDSIDGVAGLQDGYQVNFEAETVPPGETSSLFNLTGGQTKQVTLAMDILELVPRKFFRLILREIEGFDYNGNPIDFVDVPIGGHSLFLD